VGDSSDPADHGENERRRSLPWLKQTLERIAIGGPNRDIEALMP
jgi:hypothetical protein